MFVAEIGEAGRFRDAVHLVSWAGLTPKHRESDTTVRRGPITKQGSGLGRWAAVEAAQKIPASAGWLVSSRTRIAECRGRNIATVAVARKLLTLVYYGLRDRAHPHPRTGQRLRHEQAPRDRMRGRQGSDPAGRRRGRRF